MRSRTNYRLRCSHPEKGLICPPCSSPILFWQCRHCKLWVEFDAKEKLPHLHCSLSSSHDLAKRLFNTKSLALLAHRLADRRSKGYTVVTGLADCNPPYGSGHLHPVELSENRCCGESSSSPHPERWRPCSEGTD